MSAQESTKESPFYLLFGRNPRLPTESMLTQLTSPYTIDCNDYKTALNCVSPWKCLRSCQSQHPVRSKEQKLDYDVGDCVLVYMPNEVKGKLSRPFQDPYHIVNLTDCNAEVKLIELASIVILVRSHARISLWLLMLTVVIIS